MPRPKPLETMCPIGTTIPHSWATSLKSKGITNFSEYLRGLIETDLTENPASPTPGQKKRDIQTTILEICEKLSPHRNLVREYFDPSRELSAESHIMDMLKAQYAISATPTDISVAMMNIQRSTGGCVAG